MGLQNDIKLNMYTSSIYNIIYIKDLKLNLENAWNAKGRTVCNIFLWRRDFNANTDTIVPSANI
jgi:hypothetical protein